ncbi:TPR-like protein [Macrolepiota fuliginosa MF-IS2]|uniref:TPR-like protein n=1 Tax=Macrolepiota fuliginosa MF-IS2 TaxID=1400762 RepID=A0A9P5XKV6_9AGAR|nr:TPR-like protein [Macrolepiota fuliginosa MF-IS2]
MHADPSTQSFFPSLCQRFQSIVWLCLDADLTKSAVFHAERYFAIDPTNHDSRHLYAIALLREGQTYSALFLVNSAEDNQCTGCLEIKAKCCTLLGRHRQAREALEATLQDTRYLNSAFSSSRVAHAFPEEAALRCRAGNTALKGNLPDKASRSYREALSSNPYLWEAFEGLCSLGSLPEIDELFPPRPFPVKATPQNDGTLRSKPTSTGVGFFTPDGGGGGNLFKTWKPEGQTQPFRIGLPHGPRDSLATNESSFYPLEHSFQQPQPPNHRTTRSQHPNVPPQVHASRPLSSADEAGPVPKRLRSTTHQADAAKSKSSKLNSDDPSKKARARPALLFANIFSSSGRRSQYAASSRNANAPGKGNVQPTAPTLAPRRSSRLLSGTGVKQPHPSTKHSTTRDRRRQASHTRTVSAESDKDDDVFSGGDTNHLPSPTPVPLSPHAELPSSPNTWSAAQEQHAQEEYENEQADHYIYDLIRRFANATRSLAMYDCRKCLNELNQLPNCHQNTPWVLAMVGRAHFEQQDYSSAERAFKAVRDFEPHRLWDMEVYSTLLWHLQKTVDLSYLAQELLNINPQSPQAWIAIGNLFSLQKEKTQSLACFRRAAQLDPTCAYAYTLSGHESIDEDLDKAINFFQSALRADSRHYNAWYVYGLGTCYLRMSKVRLAEYHYRKALEIHSRNAVLIGCVGMAVERRGDREAALELFDRAVRLAPENALVRYRRAKILVSMRKYGPAIQDLEELRMMTPEESNVVFQLAKVYRLVGDEVKSAQMLAVARDISPKSANKIKKLLDTVKDEYGDDKMDEG